MLLVVLLCVFKLITIIAITIILTAIINVNCKKLTHRSRQIKVVIKTIQAHPVTNYVHQPILMGTLHSQREKY